MAQFVGVGGCEFCSGAHGPVPIVFVLLDGMRSKFSDIFGG